MIPELGGHWFTVSQKVMVALTWRSSVKEFITWRYSEWIYTGSWTPFRRCVPAYGTRTRGMATGWDSEEEQNRAIEIPIYMRVYSCFAATAAAAAGLRGIRRRFRLHSCRQCGEFRNLHCICSFFRLNLSSTAAALHIRLRRCLKGVHAPPQQRREAKRNENGQPKTQLTAVVSGVPAAMLVARLAGKH